jgi:hypothetical protein
MTNYKFVFDNNCEKAAIFFPKRRIVTLRQAGLTAKASDRQIVERASERQWIIVTVNGDDFIAEINRYLKETKKLECHDLSGLVILPSDHEVQRHAMHRVEEKLVFSGRRITWKDVWRLDCCVRIKKNGKVQVTRFPRCFYCEKTGTT